eukprot:298152_1
MARSVEEVYGLLFALVDNDKGFRERGVREFLALEMLERAVRPYCKGDTSHESENLARNILSVAKNKHNISGSKTERSKEGNIEVCDSGNNNATNIRRVSEAIWQTACLLVSQYQKLGRLDPSLLDSGAYTFPLADMGLGNAPEIREDEVSGSDDQRLDVAVVGHEYLKEKWLGASLSKTTYVVYLVSSRFVDSKAKRSSLVLEKGENRMQLSRHGCTVVNRRYSDFEWLRACLSISRHGILIPPLPQKERTGGYCAGGFVPLARREAFHQDRGRRLEHFLKRCVSHPVLRRSFELKLFLEANQEGIRAARTLLPWINIDLPNDNSLGNVTPTSAIAQYGTTTATAAVAAVSKGSSAVWNTMASAAMDLSVHYSNKVFFLSTPSSLCPFHGHLNGEAAASAARGEKPSCNSCKASSVLRAMSEKEARIEAACSTCTRMFVAKEELGKAETRIGRALCQFGGLECLTVIGSRLQRLCVDCRRFWDQECSLLHQTQEDIGYHKSLREALKYLEQHQKEGPDTCNQDILLSLEKEVRDYMKRRAPDLHISMLQFARSQVQIMRHTGAVWKQIAEDMASDSPSLKPSISDESLVISMSSSSHSSSFFVGQSADAS